MQSEIKKGVVLTYATLIIGNLISFIYMPYMIRCLGQSEYGLISFVNSIIAYVSLIDTGLGSSIIRYNASCIAENDFEKQSKINGMFLKLFSILSVVSIIIGIVITINMGAIFTKYTDREVWIAQRLLFLANLNLAISFPLNVFSSIVVAYEKFTFNKTITLLKTLLSPILSVLILMNGGKSIPIVAVSLFLTVFVGTMNVWYCFVRLHIKISFGKLDKEILKDIWKYSFFIFLSMIAYQIYWNTDQFIIGKVMGAVPIAIYAVGMNFNNYFRTFSDFASGIFLPRFTKMVTQGNDINDTLDDLVKVSRLQLYICGLIFTGFVLVGKQFIVRWVGSDYALAYWIALIVMTPQIISIIQSLFATLLQSLNKHNVKSYIYLFMAVVNVIFTVVLVRPYGIIGCAIGTAVGMTLNAIINNVYYAKFLRIKMGYFWMRLVRPMITIILLVVCTFVVVLMISIETYYEILLFALIYSITYIVVMWCFAFEQAEKAIVRNIFIKFKRRK